MIGLKYGKLTVIREVKKGVKPSGQKYRRFECICECGNITIIQKYSLSSGRTKSCGCIQKEAIGKVNKKHGMSLSKIERVHHMMKQRCNNPNNKDYPNYGGRGITYCKRWECFESFYEDMGEDYKENLTLDRIDVNDKYCKSNCRWATAKQQQRNKVNTLKYEYNGVILPLKEICEIEKVNYHNVWQRIKRYNKTLNEAILMG